MSSRRGAEAIGKTAFGTVVVGGWWSGGGVDR